MEIIRLVEGSDLPVRSWRRQTWSPAGPTCWCRLGRLPAPIAD